MAQEIESGNPVTRDAAALEHNPDDLRKIMEHEEMTESLILKLKETEKVASRYKDEIAKLRTIIDSMEIKINDLQDKKMCLVAEVKNLNHRLKEAELTISNLRLNPDLAKSSIKSLCGSVEQEAQDVMNDLMVNVAKVQAEIQTLQIFMVCRTKADTVISEGTVSELRGE